MSGRRRRDEDWGQGRRDPDDRRDPWADDGIDEWGIETSGRAGGDGDWSGSSARSGAGGYADRGSGQGYSAPAAPTFQAADSRGQDSRGQDQDSRAQDRGSERYGADSGYNGQRGGYGADAHSDARYGGGRGADGQSDSRYAGRGYPDPGNGRPGYGGGGYGAPGYGPDDDSGGKYGQQGYRPGGQGNEPRYGSGSGYGGGPGFPGANSRPGGPARASEFTSVDLADSDDDEPVAGRPIGRLSIYTLHNDKAKEFERLVERAAEGVRTSEPDTLVYVMHVVPKAPMQRIIYEIYRDRAALERHERQPHIRQFLADRASCVLATNVIDLRLKYAKVTALGSAPAQPPAQPQPQQPQPQPEPSWTPQAAESQQPSPTVTFTPAAGGRDQYPGNGQYGSGASGAANGQNGAANGYPAGGAGYGNGAGYPGANVNQNPNGYAGANGYSSGSGYSGANGYQNAPGYPDANGYPDADGYPRANGYVSPDRNGYPAGNGYASGGYASNSGYGGSGYGPGADRPEAGGGSRGAGAGEGSQYGQGRRRELPSGSSPDAGPGGNPDNAATRQLDSGRRGSRPEESSEWDPRSRQDQR